MASLTTTPSRLLRSPTAHPFAVFFFAKARPASAFDAFAALAGLAAAFAFAAGFFAGTAAVSFGAATAAAGAVSVSGAPPRSRRIVYARARSRRAWPIRDGFLATPIESWKRRLKISSDSSRHLAAFMHFLRSPRTAGPQPREISMAALQAPRPHHELRRDADLVGRRAERLARDVLRHAFHLVEDPARLHHGHPLLRVALALAHPRLRGLLRHRLVGKDADPHLAAALEAARERHARGLDLAIRHPARLQRLEAVLAEGQGRAALGLAAHVAALGLAVLDPLGHQHGRLLGLGGRGGSQDLALEDPHLDADRPGRRVRGGQAVVDVGADRVQRHAAVAIPLAARDLAAAQPARAGDADAVGAQAQRGRHRLLHGAAERDALLQLERDVLGDELRVELRMDDLLDVEVDLLGRARLQLVLQLLDLGALATDDDARPRGEDRDPRAVGRALDVDLRDAGVVELVLDDAPDLDVLVQEVGVVLRRKPARRPRARAAEAEADRMRLLTHRLFLLLGLTCAARGGLGRPRLAGGRLGGPRPARGRSRRGRRRHGR